MSYNLVFGFFVRFVLVVFQVLDTDRSGALTFIELREAFDIILKMNLSEEEFEAAASEMDKDSDGSVHFPEFKKYFVSGLLYVESMCFVFHCVLILFPLFLLPLQKRSKKKREEIMGNRSGGGFLEV